MFRLQGDGDIFSLQQDGERIGDLGREPLLHLGTARKEADDAGNFGESDQFAAGQISKMGSADHGHEMMLAEAAKVDFHKNDVGTARLLVCVLDKADLRELAGVEAGKNLVDIHLGDPLRRTGKGFIGEVQA